MVREGLHPFLRELGNGTEITDCGSTDELRDVLKRQDAYDLALVDLQMADGDPRHLVRLIRTQAPDLLVAVVSRMLDRRTVFDLYALGIAGFIPKRTGAAVTVSALRLILAGERYMPADLFQAEEPGEPVFPAPPVANDSRPSSETALTLREREILQLVREGLANKLIARRLNISEVTVKSHLCHVFRKLGVQNRLQAARYAALAD
ncbi:DNA-binding response regulator (plasmid) [Azospirillum thermophilum]|uniref:DNA-binding response regulator n=2 Tax=Azospirillum thermophilum TaxID=2202148 RepID=A0A2S2CXB7_9PROT|nr:DNA-binding response regulator [Azospirillum thermophilum]